MKVLLDMPVSRSLLRVLAAHGHTGVHAFDIGFERATDEQLLDLAQREDRVIVTADLDFPRLLALASARGPGLVLFRGGNYSDAEMAELLDRVLTEVPSEVLESAVCVVDRHRIRITHLPLRRQ